MWVLVGQRGAQWYIRVVVGQAPEEGSHRGLVRLVVAGLIWPLTYVVFQILSDVLPPQHGYQARPGQVSGTAERARPETPRGNLP